MSIITNYLLFNHAYLRQLQADDSVDQEASLAAQGVRDWYGFRDNTSTESLVESWVTPLLNSLELELEPLTPGDAHVHLLYTAWDHATPVGLCYVTPPGADLDTTTKGEHWMAQAVLAARKWEPTSARDEEHEVGDEQARGLRWVILTNGDQWRLLDAGALRRYEAYLQVDLEELVRNPGDLSALRVFYRCFHRSAFERDAGGPSGLDRLQEDSNHATEQAEDHLKARVSHNEGIMARLCMGFVQATGKRHFTEEERDAIYQDATYLLYRILFILYAEARDLLPMDNPAYRRTSLTQLVETAYEYKLNGIPDHNATTLWGRLKRLCNAIYESDPALGIPAYNGGLFDDADKPYLRDGTVADAHLTEALFDLAYMPDKVTGTSEVPVTSPYQRIDYRDLSVRHLGSIYEGMIEYKLQIAEETLWARRDGKGNVRFLRAGQDGAPRRTDVEIKQGDVYFSQSPGERRATGTYYTPEYIVDYIVRQTVGRGLQERRAPLEEKLKGWLEEVQTSEVSKTSEVSAMQRTADGELLRFVEEQVLTFRVCDPAMGSGHFLVNAAHQITNFIVETLHLTPWVNEAIETDPVAWRRRVVEHCLYGVDLSLMAVELAKLSLWLASVAEGKALSFLKHQLHQGNSLIGVRPEDLAEVLVGTTSARPSRREQKEREAGQLSMLDHPAFRQHVSAATDLLARISARVAETVEDVNAQAVDYDEVRAELEPFRQLANVIVARYFGVDIDRQQLCAISSYLIDTVGPSSEYLDVLGEAQESADEQHFFHWELEFPLIFFDTHDHPLVEESGFDAVVGNPPYGIVFDIAQKKYIEENVPSFVRNNDLYAAFSERCMTLLRTDGLASMIIPNTFIMGPYFNRLKKSWLAKAEILFIDDFGYVSLFPDPNVFSAVFLCKRSSTGSTQETLLRDACVKDGKVCYSDVHRELLKHLPLEQWKPFSLVTSKAAERGIYLDDLCFVKDVGFNYWTKGRGKTRGGSIGSRVLYDGPQEHPKDIPFLKGSDFSRYGEPISHDHWLRHDYEAFLDPDVDTLRFSPEFLQIPEKIVYRQTADHIIATMDRKGHLVDKTVHVVLLREGIGGYSLGYLLAILNSKVSNQVYRDLAREEGRTFAQVKTFRIKQLPIRDISFSTPTYERARLAVQGQKLYGICMHGDNQRGVLDFIERQLNYETERADVVHDLLAYLAEQMIDLNKERRRLEHEADLFRFVEPDTSCLQLDKALGGPLGVGEMVSDLSAVRHDIEGLRLSQEEDGRWLLEVYAKLRDPDSGWREHQRDQAGNFIRQWLPVYRVPLDEATGRFYYYAFANLAGFEGAGKFPGGFTRTTLEKLKATKVPRFVPVDLEPLAALEAELDEVRRKIRLTDDLIDQIVYRLYGLTEEEIAIVEGRA